MIREEDDRETGEDKNHKVVINQTNREGSGKASKRSTVKFKENTRTM